MKKAIILAIGIALLSALASADTMLDRPLPSGECVNGGSPCNSAFVPDGLVFGDSFTTSAAWVVGDFSVWVVGDVLASSLPATGGSATAPDATATLWMAPIANLSMTAVAVSTSYARDFYNTDQNYLASLDSTYLPLFSLTFSSLNYALDPGTYLWAVSFGGDSTYTDLRLHYSASPCTGSDQGGGCDDNLFFTADTSNFNNGAWIENYGVDANVLATGDQSVPEPGTLLLIAAGAGIIALSRRRSA